MGKHRRYSVERRISWCAICGCRVNRRNGIGFTLPNPDYSTDPDKWTGPYSYRTCGAHDRAPYPEKVAWPQGVPRTL